MEWLMASRYECLDCLIHEVALCCRDVGNPSTIPWWSIYFNLDVPCAHTSISRRLSVFKWYKCQWLSTPLLLAGLSFTVHQSERWSCTWDKFQLHLSPNDVSLPGTCNLGGLPAAGWAAAVRSTGRPQIWLAFSRPVVATQLWKVNDVWMGNVGKWQGLGSLEQKLWFQGSSSFEYLWIVKNLTKHQVIPRRPKVAGASQSGRPWACDVEWALASTSIESQEWSKWHLIKKSGFSNELHKKK